MTANDEDTVTRGEPTVGDMLRAARKKKKLSLEDVASQTRIPLRHLESLEASDWAHLPAPTYTVGFAKSYAAVVDLDRAEISERLRGEMGGHRATISPPPEVFEPADPARTMPKWLVLSAILAVVLVVGLMSWLNNRSLDGDEEVATNETATAALGNTVATAPAQPSVPQGPVVLSAKEPLWLAIKEKGGETYFAGILKPGSDFTVPPNAVAPLLSTARPESLVIRVGTATAPAIGTPGASVTDVSLLPSDLMAPKPAAVETTPPSADPPRAVAQAPRRSTTPARRPPPAPVPAPAPATPPADEPAPTSNSGA